MPAGRVGPGSPAMPPPCRPAVARAWPPPPLAAPASAGLSSAAPPPFSTGGRRREKKWKNLSAREQTHYLPFIICPTPPPHMPIFLSKTYTHRGGGKGWGLSTESVVHPVPPRDHSAGSQGPHLRAQQRCCTLDVRMGFELATFPTLHAT